MAYQHLVNFWPLVPAFDLQNVFESHDSNQSSPSYYDQPYFLYEMGHSNRSVGFQNEKKILDDTSGDESIRCNYLIIGDGIGCLFKTLSRMHRYRNTNLKIYIISSYPESLARNLLLLSLFGDISLSSSLLERAETFLDILGNIHVRSSTKAFLDTKSVEFIEKIGNLRENKHILPFVSLEHFKQREIDVLLQAFTYIKDETEFFRIGKGWENALRAYYGTRYDNRRNLFDYHFNMKLSDFRMINLKKYIDWCETGIAFRFRQSKYNYPNKTMHIPTPQASRNNDDVDAYVGDIATSPFVAFGVETGNLSLLKQSNGVYTSNSLEISKFNVIDMANEFISNSKKDKSRSVMVYPLSFETFSKMHVHMFQKFFDAVYVTCDMMPRVNTLLSNVLKENGIAVFETIKNVVNSTNEQKEMYCEEIDRIAHFNGLEAHKVKQFDKNKHFKMFILKEELFENDGLFIADNTSELKES